MDGRKVISTVAADTKPTVDEKFPIKETLVSADGDVYVNIQTTKPRAAQVQIIEVRFTDSKQNLLVHMNYDISVIQSGFELFAEKNHHTDDGTEEHAVKAQTDKPIDVKISLRGIYPEGEKPRPVSQTLVFEKIPEFGFISIVILGAALSSVAIFASRIKILKI